MDMPVTSTSQISDRSVVCKMKPYIQVFLTQTFPTETKIFKHLNELS